MLLQALRLTRWRGRRPLSAVLAFVYLWAFAAVGLTHLHPAPRAADTHGKKACQPLRGYLASGPAAGTDCVLAPAVSTPDDKPCLICVTAQATAVALAQPPAAGRIMAPGCRIAPSFTSPAPLRSTPAPQPRGPPQA